MKQEIYEFLDQSNAIEDVFDQDSLDQAVYAWQFIIKEKELTTSIIKKTHKILMLHQKIYGYQKGYWREEDVMVGGEVKSPHTEVPALMRQWVVNANDLVANSKNEHKEFLGSMVKQHHVKFEDIHPFIDGNGRLGRILMNWERVRVKLPIFIILAEERQEYYKWFK